MFLTLEVRAGHNWNGTHEALINRRRCYVDGIHYWESIWKEASISGWNGRALMVWWIQISPSKLVLHTAQPLSYHWAAAAKKETIYGFLCQTRRKLVHIWICYQRWCKSLMLMKQGYPQFTNQGKLWPKLVERMYGQYLCREGQNTHSDNMFPLCCDSKYWTS